MPVVAGVDSSTQSSTVALYDADTGELLGTGRAPHPVTHPPVSEQRPAAWWSAMIDAFAGARAAAGVDRQDIVAISIGAQCHGLVPLDAAGAVIRPAKLWNDTTSSAQADRLRATYGVDGWLERTGSYPPPAFTISKLLWFAEEEPHLFDRLRHVLLPHDWLTHRLTGLFTTDRSEASGTGYYSARRDAYDLAVLGLVDGTRDWSAMLPAVLGPNAPAGRVLPEAAREIGVADEAIVGAGGGDQHLGALGLGVELGDLVIVLGTSGVVYGPSASEVRDPLGDVTCVADAAGGFLPIACTLNAAKVTDTFARLLGVDHGELAAMALRAPRADDRPVLAAYLDGERTPNRPHARGAIAGITTATTREEIALAAFEGVVFGLLAGVDALERAGMRFDSRVILTGGAAQSPAYRQLFADSLGREVSISDRADAVAAGAAIQAAAVLRGEDVLETAARWAPPTRVAASPGPLRSTVRDRYRNLADWKGLDR